MDESNKPLKWKVTNVTQTSGVIDDNSRLFMNALQNLQGNGGEESVSVMCYENTSIGDKTWKVTFTQELTNNTRIVEIKQTACEDVETYAISGCRIYRMSPTVVPASGTSNLRVYYSASTTTTHSCGGSVETGTTSGSTTYSAISANDSTEQRTIPISVSVRWKGKTCTASSSITQSGKACSKTGYTIDCDNVSTSLTSTIEATSTSATISYTAPLMWHDDCGNSGIERNVSGNKDITFSANPTQSERVITTSITISSVSGSNQCTASVKVTQPAAGEAIWQRVEGWTGETCEQSKTAYQYEDIYYNNGNLTIQVIDVNPSSPTYNQTMLSAITDTQSCPIPDRSPIWETISEECMKDGDGRFTGMKRVVLQNVNRYSDTYKDTKGYNVTDTVMCPIGMKYCDLNIKVDKGILDIAPNVNITIGNTTSAVTSNTIVISSFINESTVGIQMENGYEGSSKIKWDAEIEGCLCGTDYRILLEVRDPDSVPRLGYKLGGFKIYYDGTYTEASEVTIIYREN